MKWSDITLEQYNRIQETITIEEDEQDRLIEIMKIIYGDEVEELSLADFSKKLREVDFLNKPMAKHKSIKHYVVNGRKYNILSNLGDLTAAQYIDYTNLLKTGEMNKYLAVFFIPDGHKYNDGYDMEEVINDILSVDIETISSLSFFFKRQFQVFIKIFQYYLGKNIKETKLPKKTKKTLLETMKKLVNLGFFHS